MRVRWTLNLIKYVLVKPAGGVGGGGGRGERAWGRDLIVFVGPGVGHFIIIIINLYLYTKSYHFTWSS